MTRRPRPAIWLARPSRYAEFSTSQARVLLVVVAVLVVLSWTALLAPDTSVLSAGGDAVDQSILDAVRHGAGYYPAASDTLRSDGSLNPFAAVRPPTLGPLLAQLPAAVTPVLLYLLTVATAFAWLRRLRVGLASRTARWVAMLLFAGGCITAWAGASLPAYQVWTGLLIALSLARRRPGVWIEAVGWGLLATLVDVLAAPFLLVMLGLAWREGEWREAIGWLGVLATVMLVEAAHFHALAQITATPILVLTGWDGWAASTGNIVWSALAAPLSVLAWAGWTVWRDPLGTRVAVTLAVQVAVSALLGASTALPLCAPVLLIGLVFVPDGWRDLVAGAVDRRRITVRRVSL